MNTPAPEQQFQVRDPHYVQRIRASFAQQNAMTTIGAQLMEVTPGRVVIEMDWNPQLTQQLGYMHGGMIGVPLDSACGYCAMTLTPADTDMLTIEYKVNFLSPAVGERLRFTGLVLKAGRTITITESCAYVLENDQEKLVAKMVSTLITIPKRSS